MQVWLQTWTRHTLPEGFCVGLKQRQIMFQWSHKTRVKTHKKLPKNVKKRLHFAPKGHFFRVFESFCFCIGSKKFFKKRNEILRVAWWTPKFMLKDWVLAPLINSTLNILNLQPPLSTRNFSKSENTRFLISQSFVV